VCRLGGAGMNNVITFPNKVKTLREKIHDGKITNEIKILLLKELDQLTQYHPDSWDKKFTENMLTYKNKLTDKQINQLERILQDPILEEEYPNGIKL
jgi:cell wall assembly regulator SMI1